MEILCSVCTDVLFGDTAIVATSCCHVFHEDCIKNWISRSKTCPECRACLMNDNPRRLFFSSEPKDHTVAKYFKEILNLRREMKTQKEHFEEQLLAEVEIRRHLNEKLQTLQRQKAPPTGTVTSRDLTIVNPRSVFSTNFSQEVVDLTQDSEAWNEDRVSVGRQATVMKSSNQDTPNPKENQPAMSIPESEPEPSFLQMMLKETLLPPLVLVKDLPIATKRLAFQPEGINDGPTVKKSKP